MMDSQQIKDPRQIGRSGGFDSNRHRSLPFLTNRGRSP
jgi:hypothetical protein